MNFSALIQLPVLLGTLASACYADTLVLHDGRVVEGDVRGLLTGQDASMSDSAGNSITLSDVAATHFGSSKSEVDRTMLLSTFRTDAMSIRMTSALIEETKAPAKKGNNGKFLPPRLLTVVLEITNNDTRRQLEFKSHSLFNENYEFRMRDDVLNRVRHHAHGFYLARNGQAVRVDRVPPEENCRAIVVFEEPLPKTKYVILDLSPTLIEISGQPAPSKPILFFIPTLVFSTPESQLAALIAEKKDVVKTPNLFEPTATPTDLLHFVTQQSAFGKGEALLSFAQLQAEAGEGSTALAALLQAMMFEEERGYSYNWERAVRYASFILAALGEFEQATAMTNKSPHPESAMADFCLFLASKGDISNAVALARRISDVSEATKTLGTITYLQSLKMNEVFKILVQAVAIAQTAQESSEQESALINVVPRLVSIDLKYAENLALTSGFPSIEAIVSCEVARSQADSGKTELALATLNRALVLANKCNNEDVKESCLIQIATELSHQQYSDIAFTVAQSIKSDFSRKWTLLTVTETLASAGKLDEAIGLARTIRDEEWRGMALGRISKVQAQTGDFKDSVALARTIEDTRYREVTFGEIGVILTEMSLTEKGVAIVREIEDADRRAESLGDISKALAETGDFKSAVRIARTIENPTSESSSLDAIATLQIKAGETKAALDTLTQAILVSLEIKDSFDKDSALSDIATSLAKADIFAQAIDVALTISNSELRAMKIRDLSYYLSTELVSQDNFTIKDWRTSFRRVKNEFTDKESQIAELLVEASGHVDDR